MGRKILIERFRDPNKTLKYLKESGVAKDGKHYIGRLEGPAADFTEPTRNGNFYCLQLWKNVESSDDFKEGMSTHTIFGEADHPEERLDTSIKEIAICLREFEIREDEGIVWCSFDILDTPNGRIVKELLDYGSQLGVSSRGSGEEDEEKSTEDMIYIDPNSFIFVGFDVVVMPAVAKARPTRIESVSHSKSARLVESIQNEINNATSKQELNTIKTIVESQNIPGTDSLLESLNKKLNDDSEDDVLINLTTDLANLTSENERLESHTRRLQESLSASDARVSELRSLLNSKISNSRRLRQAIKENKQYISSLERDILECHDQNSDYSSVIESLRRKVSSLEHKNRTLTESYEKSQSELTDVRKELDLVNSRSKLAVSTSQNYLTESRNLKSDNKSLTESVTVLRKQLTESRKRAKSLEDNNQKLTESIQSYRRGLNSYMEGYVLLKSRQTGIPVETVRSKLPKNPSVKNVDSIVESLSDRKTRMNRIPVNLNEGFIVDPKMTMSDEDAQTMGILSQALGQRTNN